MSDRYAGGVPVAEVVRSGFVEGRHHGSLAAIDASGARTFAVGDPDGPIFPRSSNKPLQAVAMLRAGLPLAPENQRAAEPDLAVVAASHHGEPMHVSRVRGLLASGGLSEFDLRCPKDLPVSEEARAEVLRAGGSASRVFMNCSGKHSGMLLTCQSAGWSLSDYLAPAHPMQEACGVAVAELAGEPVAATGMDGCGAQVVAISLTGLARAFLRLVSAQPGTAERRVADSMRAHPELCSGTGADDARLMRAVPGLLSKVGAEGVLVVAVPGAGAVALKIDDGANRARLPVLVSALARFGLSTPELDELSLVPLLGGGFPVGAVHSLL